MPSDYVVVDDVGDFAYYPSEGAMLRDLEYVQEASCILDRMANGYRLLLDDDRVLRKGPSLGPVDFHWLSRAWAECQRRHQRAHRLHRFYFGSLESLLAGLFEILYLEGAAHGASSAWTLEVGGETTHPVSLREVDGILSGVDHLERATVHDPFGHGYRPIRQASRWSLTPAGKPIHYVEIPRLFRWTAP